MFVDSTGRTIPYNINTETMVDAVNTGNGATNYSNDQLSTVKSVTKDIVEVSRDKGVEPAIALGIAKEESKLGIGATVAANQGNPAKAPDVNPMQLSGGRAVANDRRANIAGALNVFTGFNDGRRTLNQVLDRYGGSQSGYANRVEANINGIRSTVSEHRETRTLNDQPLRFGFPR